MRVLDVYAGGAEHGDDAEAGEEAGGACDGGLAEGDGVFWEAAEGVSWGTRVGGQGLTWKSKRRG